MSDHVQSGLDGFAVPTERESDGHPDTSGGTDPDAGVTNEQATKVLTALKQADVDLRRAEEQLLGEEECPAGLISKLEVEKQVILVSARLQTICEEIDDLQGDIRPDDDYAGSGIH